MAKQELTCICRILRYAPNILRDEHVNIGVLLYDPAGGRTEMRLIESESEFARLRRVHPAADLSVVRGLEGELRGQLTQAAGGTEAWLEKLDTTLSNTLQLSPQRAVLTTDLDGELERIYGEQVAPQRVTGASADSPASLRARANEILGRADVLRKMKRGLRVEEFTYPGDPMRLDYGYQENGTRGFLHTLSLDRDPAQAKALAFTSERVRARVSASEFTALCESSPKDGNTRHRFVVDLLSDQRIALIALPELEGWARALGDRLN